MMNIGLKKSITSCLLPLACIAASLLCTPAQARHIVASNSFDTIDHAWYSSNGWATVNRETSGGATGSSGWLSTTWTNISRFDPLAVYAVDMFVVDATNLFAGDWSTNLWFELDFPAGTKMDLWDIDDFIDDLAHIDWIGVGIERSSGDAGIGGINNSNLMVPEPVEIILLLFAGVSSLMTLRKKKR